MPWRPEFRAVAAEPPVAVSPATSTRAVGPHPGEAAPWTPPSAAPLASTRGSSMLCSSPRLASVRCRVPEPAKHAADPLSPRCKQSRHGQRLRFVLDPLLLCRLLCIAIIFGHE